MTLIYSHQELIHHTTNLYWFSVVCIGNLDTIAWVTCVDYQTTSNIHRHMVDPAAVAVEEQISWLR